MNGGFLLSLQSIVIWPASQRNKLKTQKAETPTKKETDLNERNIILCQSELDSRSSYILRTYLPNVTSCTYLHNHVWQESSSMVQLTEPSDWVSLLILCIV